MSRWVFEPGTTVQFTFTSSVPPDAVPALAVYQGNTTLVASITAVQSDTTHYYALYTLPDQEGAYTGEWAALKTFQGSLRNFVDRFAFNVTKTRAS